MPKFATRPPVLHAPILTTEDLVFTHEGGIGVARDAKSDLFLLAATNMVSEHTFYETATARDERFEKLVHTVVAEDPAWVARFVKYLRDGMQMRSASIVLAAEYVKAGGEHGRAVVNAALLRADEPGEMLAYWRSRHHRALPAAIKRGVADAVNRLYTERNALKYDGQSKVWRFADVIEAVHPTPANPAQSVLFKYLLDDRHHNDGTTEGLETLTADAKLREMSEGNRRAALGGDIWTTADWSWERLSGWLPGGMDAEAWEAVIPQMGYMALLRNLRNFDNAGVSDAAAQDVIARLTDPEQVAKSRQFPIRFYSAYREIASLRWAGALERALDLSLTNVPNLRGRTLILVDRSGSMQSPISGRSTRARWEIAALFGFALAKRADQARVVAYGTGAVDATSLISAPLLRTVEQMPPDMGGTNTFGALNAAFENHDRIVILTDEQAHDAGHYPLPAVPIFTFNLAGYAPAHLPSGERNRYTFGGLTDAAFRLVPMLEQSRDGTWPF